ncbi:MAG: SDR family NAD(P)-dependent oxidoreductase [Actinophytocola sp.]|uniref:oxidoreductase n=1 Tax=Actinophytocola sp. TaxID=1872138 RepID=UPI001328FCE2|nr:oxidoreductase [Actinophytocola sp.]MPZ85944.1 SDR family NAD(P)-dependent oxidoreductase [Actinophytocola sp.]
MAKWTAADIPDQTGRTAVVTGANSGLGLVTARALAKAGGRVILACRDIEKGRRAAATMPGTVEVRALDLANLASIRTFAESVTEDVDLLINNAGVMAVPHRRTADGFEMQFGTNHLGHFALTGLLLPKLKDRVVTLSSSVHGVGRINLDDLNRESRGYMRWPAYAQSKLANLLFTFELTNRLKAAGSKLTAYSAHPGYASTNLQSHTETFMDNIMSLGNRLIAQSAAMGALPTLYAATADIEPGSFAGPGGFMGQRGYPKVVGSVRAARDPKVAKALWDKSEERTHVSYRLNA